MNLHDDPTNTTPSNQARTPGSDMRRSLLDGMADLDSKSNDLREENVPPSDDAPPSIEEDEDTPDEQEGSEEEGEEADEEEAPEDADDLGLDEDEEDEEPGEEDEEDAELEKRLGKLSKAERRGKQRLAKERDQFETAAREKALELEEREKKVAEREKLDAPDVIGRELWSNTGATLKRLGVETPERAEALAKQIYRYAKGESGDPKYQEAAAQEARAAKQASEIAALREELKSWKEEQNQRDTQREVHEYLTRIEEGIGEHCPNVQNARKRDPEKARTMITNAAQALYATTGKRPASRDVLRVAEAMASGPRSRKQSKKKSRPTAKKTKAARKQRQQTTASESESLGLEEQREAVHKAFLEAKTLS